jgi:hypothetical protein
MGKIAPVNRDSLLGKSDVVPFYYREIVEIGFLVEVYEEAG